MPHYVNDEEFTFVWSIENFHIVGAKIACGFSSPSFYLKNFFNTEWCLVLHPRVSKVGEEEGYISCELRREYDDGPEHIGIDFQLSVGPRTFKRKYVFGNMASSGVDKFIKEVSETRFSANVFVVKCNMRMINSDEIAAHSKKSMFSSLLTFVKTSNYEKKDSLMKKQLKELYRKHVTYSPWCHCHSHLPVEKRFITYSIRDVVGLERNGKLHILVTSFTMYPSFLITLFSRSSFGDIEIEISSLREMYSDILSLCEIELLDSSKDICKYAKDEHFFKATVEEDTFYCYEQCVHIEQEKEIWHYKHAIKMRDLQKMEDGTINFIMTLSDYGAYWENCIIHSDYNFSSSVEKSSPGTLPREMFRLYSENKLCDLCLQTKDKTFEVHRNVLAAMSPVFAAMFENGLLEADGKVHIDDLDSETVSQMIHFLYTEDAAELQFESAMKLFGAADKYQIASLKEACRNFFKRNCSVGNISLVLSLANSYNDKELQKLVIYYSHRKDIL